MSSFEYRIWRAGAPSPEEGFRALESPLRLSRALLDVDTRISRGGDCLVLEPADSAVKVTPPGPASAEHGLIPGVWFDAFRFALGGTAEEVSLDCLGAIERWVTAGGRSFWLFRERNSTPTLERWHLLQVESERRVVRNQEWLEPPFIITAAGAAVEVRDVRTRPQRRGVVAHRVVFDLGPLRTAVGADEGKLDGLLDTLDVVDDAQYVGPGEVQSGLRASAQELLECVRKGSISTGDTWFPVPIIHGKTSLPSMGIFVVTASHGARIAVVAEATSEWQDGLARKLASLPPRDALPRDWQRWIRDPKVNEDERVDNGGGLTDDLVVQMLQAPKAEGTELVRLDPRDRLPVAPPAAPSAGLGFASNAPAGWSSHALQGLIHDLKNTARAARLAPPETAKRLFEIVAVMAESAASVDSGIARGIRFREPDSISFPTLLRSLSVRGDVALEVLASGFDDLEVDVRLLALLVELARNGLKHSRHSDDDNGFAELTLSRVPGDPGRCTVTLVTMATAADILHIGECFRRPILAKPGKGLPWIRLLTEQLSGEAMWVFGCGDIGERSHDSPDLEAWVKMTPSATLFRCEAIFSGLKAITDGVER